MEELCEPDAIYAITTLGQGPEGVRARTVGLFLDLGEAEEVLRLDLGDLNEAGHYSFAVIETISTQLYPDCRRRVWYGYDEGWRPLSESSVPDCYRLKQLGKWTSIG